MSSTVGYGVEISKEDGDYWEGEQVAAKLGLEIVTSRAEYGDEERVFLLDGDSIMTAGKEDNTALALTITVPVNIQEKIDRFFKETDNLKATSALSWWLVDYYVYS